MCKTCVKTLESLFMSIRKLCGLFWDFCTHFGFCQNSLWKTSHKSTFFASILNIFCTKIFVDSHLKIVVFPPFTHRSITTTTNLINKKEKLWN
jgi:hypothetical protein